MTKKALAQQAKAIAATLSTKDTFDVFGIFHTITKSYPYRQDIMYTLTPASDYLGKPFEITGEAIGEAILQDQFVRHTSA